MRELEIGVVDRKILILDYLKGFSIFTIALMHLIHMIPNIPKLIITFSMIGGGGVMFFLFVQEWGYIGAIHIRKRHIQSF